MGNDLLVMQHLAVEWNKLDVEIRLLSNLETFKKKVKTYLFNIAFT